MSSLGWNIEEDSFEQNTVIGRVRFTNIIATLDPTAPRRMVIACHYDSKRTPQGFLGATDSAVPCAQMINLAKTLQSELNALKGQICKNDRYCEQGYFCNNRQSGTSRFHRVGAACLSPE